MIVDPLRFRPRSRRIRVFACAIAGAGTAFILAVAPPPAGASLIGICPDGSMFVVQRTESIPCRDAKIVEPDEVPPVRSEYLPRPYAWEVFHRRKDPNNPYNLIDAARQARDLRDRPRVPRSDASEDRASTGRTAGVPRVLPAVSSAPGAAEALPLAISPDDVRNLALIVELAQRRAPATLDEADTGPVLRFSRSAAFEARVYDAAARTGREPAGHVVLFSATASRAHAFHPNLTFVQDHVAFHPDSADPHQLGVLLGRIGTVAPGAPILGYAVLPEALDLSRPMDIYWNDHRLTATLSPESCGSRKPGRGAQPGGYFG